MGKSLVIKVLNKRNNLSNISLLAFCFFVFLLSSRVFPQIIIKEKVEINPQTVNPESPNSSNEHIFTYTLTWTPDQYRRGNIRIVDCNDDTLNSGWTTSGYATISFTANGRHHYLFQEERWFYHNFNGWGWWGSTHPGRLFQVFIDDINQNHPQNVLGSYNGLPNDFDLRFNGSTCPNNYAGLSVGDVNWNDCNVPCFYDGDVTELNIIQGSEYVTFIDIPTETILGSFVQLSDYAGINNIGLQRKDDAPIVQTLQIIRVEANINGVKDTLEIEYFPDTFILNAEVYPETLTTGETAYIDISYYNECGPLPPETKINLEIINGIEFGNLIDPYTNEKVKTITDLDHWWGYAWVEYIADGKPKDGTDTITIRISTTDPDIIPKEINVYIKPPPIYVYTNPDFVGAADTVEIVIKKRNSDGTLEDFPPEQAFELAVLDGCVNGNILVGDSLGVYFSDSQQPIYFVAADSVAGDSGIVRLRVGSDLGGSSMKPLTQGDEKKEKFTDEQTKIAEQKASYKKMIEEKKAAVTESKSGLKGELPTEAPILEVCYYGSYLYETGYWAGDVVVEMGNCFNFACTESIPIKCPEMSLHKFKIVDYPNLAQCDDDEKAFTAGFFRPLFDEPEDNLKDQFLENFNIQACYDLSVGLWKFKVNNGIGFRFKAIQDICLSNLDEKILINGPLDLIDKIPDNLVCDALKDFEDQRRYYRGDPRPNEFYVIEKTRQHEEVHSWQFNSMINHILKKKSIIINGHRILFVDAFALAKECKAEFTNEIEATINGKYEYENIMKEFIEALKSIFQKEIDAPVFYKGVSKGWKVYEILAQWNPSTQSVIDVFQSDLISFRDKNLTKDCDYEIPNFLEEDIYNYIINNR